MEDRSSKVGVIFYSHLSAMINVARQMRSSIHGNDAYTGALDKINLNLKLF
jgi:hypothetical protein